MCPSSCAATCRTSASLLLLRAGATSDTSRVSRADPKTRRLLPFMTVGIRSASLTESFSASGSRAGNHLNVSENILSSRCVPLLDLTQRVTVNFRFSWLCVFLSPYPLGSPQIVRGQFSEEGRSSLLGKLIFCCLELFVYSHPDPVTYPICQPFGLPSFNDS